MKATRYLTINNLLRMLTAFLALFSVLGVRATNSIRREGESALTSFDGTNSTLAPLDIYTLTNSVNSAVLAANPPIVSSKKINATQAIEKIDFSIKDTENNGQLGARKGLRYIHDNFGVLTGISHVVLLKMAEYVYILSIQYAQQLQNYPQSYKRLVAVGQLLNEQVESCFFTRSTKYVGNK